MAETERTGSQPFPQEAWGEWADATQAEAVHAKTPKHKQERTVWLVLREGGEEVGDKADEPGRAQLTPPDSGTFPSMFSPSQLPKCFLVSSHTLLSVPGPRF